VTYLRQVRGNRLVGVCQAGLEKSGLERSIFWEREHRVCEEFQLRHLDGNQHRLRLQTDMRMKSLMEIYDEVAWLLPRTLPSSDMHRACSWVIDFKFTVSSLLSSEEGLKLKDIPEG